MNRCQWCLENMDGTFTFAELLYRNAAQSNLCNQCLNHLEPVSGETKKCAGCEKVSEQPLCLDCMNWEMKYPAYPFKHRSLYYYNAFAKDYMEKYKVVGDCVLSSVFAHELSAYFKTQFKGALIVPIPISRHSKQTRGFNQVELLLDSAGIPYMDILENRGTGEKQSRKNKKERMEMNQPFVVKTSISTEISRASIVLVDDLYTTGRTVFYAAEALNGYAPRKLETFSLFR